MRKFLISTLLPLTLVACSRQWTSLYDVEDPRTVSRILDKTPIEEGEAEAGFTYLTQGEYVGSGFPWSFMQIDSTVRKDTILMREGDNALVPWFSIAFKTDNGATVVSGSCFSCHAATIAGEMTLGLGSRNSEFTNIKLWQQPFFPWLVKQNATEAEWEATQDYIHWLAHSFPWIKTDQVGLNPAFRLEEAFAAHRDPVTLAYSQSKVFPRRGPNVAADVPPLWNVKKKNALYYNGMGRGDFTKLLMQAGLMGIPDTATAREIQQEFVNVVAWLEALEPPIFSGEIDEVLAEAGRELFEENCQKCHGRYDPNPKFETYPNKLVPMWEIQTDPAYAQYFMQYSGLPEWFNESWFGQSPPQAQMLASNGYVAPPLDGVWATAPYLHNGSVPTLEELLNSPQRPDVWMRAIDSDQFDEEKMGISYEMGEGEGVVYDCSKPGQGNQGHYFGDEFTKEARQAVIEYLKTL